MLKHRMHRTLACTGHPQAARSPFPRAVDRRGPLMLSVRPSQERSSTDATDRVSLTPC